MGDSHNIWTVTPMFKPLTVLAIFACFLDFVDNRLLDLYGVELGELVEATSLLTPYMMAYCHSKKHLVQKFAQELMYYGYAGLQSHFTYLSLLTATKGLKSDIDSEAKNNALMTKLYKFAKTAEVFREASSSEPGRALHLKLEDEILKQVTKDETSITDWLKKRIINRNDWPYQCLLKDANGQEKNTLLIRYQKINQIKSHWIPVNGPAELLINEPWATWKTNFESVKTYVRAPTRVVFNGQCDKPGKDNVMFVSYYPNPCCGEERKVFVTWKKMAVCFSGNSQEADGIFRNCDANDMKECEFDGPENMLNTADRF